MRFTCTRPDDLQIPSCADIVTLPPVCSLAFLTWPPFITRLFEYSWINYCYFESTFMGICNSVYNKGHALNHMIDLRQSKVYQLAFGTFLCLTGINISYGSGHNYNRHAVGYLRWLLLLLLGFFGDGEGLRAVDKKFLGWIQVSAVTARHTSMMNLYNSDYVMWKKSFFDIFSSVMEEYQLADPGSRFKHSERFIQVRSKTSLSLQDNLSFLLLLPNRPLSARRNTRQLRSRLDLNAGRLWSCPA